MGKSKVEKLAKFVKEIFDVDLEPTSFKRTYAGHYQRSNGAWSWFMREKNTYFEIGSADSVTNILKYKDYVTLLDDELIIENDKQRNV